MITARRRKYNDPRCEVLRNATGHSASAAQRLRSGAESSKRRSEQKIGLLSRLARAEPVAHMVGTRRELTASAPKALKRLKQEVPFGERMTEKTILEKLERFLL